jgi:NTE family protein
MTLPYNWLWPNDRMTFLRQSYQRLFAGDTRLQDLPDKPEFVFCSTDMTFGVNWEFSKKRVGDWLAGYVKGHQHIEMARAIAASSAFPPLFGPMRMGRHTNYSGGSYVGVDREELQTRLELTDGGVYDNLGTEPAIKKYATVLISDAGAPFAFTVLSGWRRLLRYTQVIGNQAVSLRKRMFFTSRRRNDIEGAYWGIADSGQLPVEGYSKRLVNEVIGRIRTDLDRFTAVEFDVLINHGYLTCNNALQYLGDGSARSIDSVWPYPTMQNEDLVRKELRTSHRRFFHLRWFAWSK